MSDVHAAEAATTSAPVEAQDTEVRARRLGWVPKEEFKGDPAKHRSADEFLQRGTTILPILQKDNERLHGQVGALERRLNEVLDTTKELVKHHETAAERAYDRARADIEAKIEQAATNADPAAARAATRELEALKPPVKAPERKEEPKVIADPVIQDWISKEDWFNRDKTLNAVATAIFGEIEQAHPGMSRAEQLAETKRRTVEKFPEKFGINPARNGAAAVAEPNGSTAPRRKAGKTYDDLPAEAKKACDKFVSTIPGYTREKYVKDYDWND